MVYAFDLLELDGKDLRALPLGERKAKLAKVLARAPVGIAFNEHTNKDGATVFRHACKMALEGIVSNCLTGLARPGIGSRSRTRTARDDETSGWAVVTDTIDELTRKARNGQRDDGNRRSLRRQASAAFRRGGHCQSAHLRR